MKIRSSSKIYYLFILVFFLQAGITDCYSQKTSTETLLKTYDASTLDWNLWGYRPETWRMNFNFTNFTGTWAELIDIPVDVPGSVRNALLKEKISIFHRQRLHCRHTRVKIKFCLLLNVQSICVRSTQPQMLHNGK